MRSSSFRTILVVLLLLAVVSACAAKQVKVEKIAYFNQPNCYELSNGQVDVIATSDIGPRIISYSLTGRQNILGEMTADAVVKTKLGDWHPWGGHRLWHAPEELPRTYAPDDGPVKVETVGTDSIRLTQQVESATGIEKEMLIKLDGDGSRVTITHKLTNKGIWPVQLAPWALTIMRGGGTTIIPQEPFVSHDEKLLPARTLTLWNYTDLSDKRFTFLKKYICLQTDSAKKNTPTKLGVANRQGWAAYQCGDVLFVKRLPYVEGATYPDMGCNFETYTDGDFMEIETVAPLTTLQPGQSATHVEYWYLFSYPTDGRDPDREAELDKSVMPLVNKTATVR